MPDVTIILTDGRKLTSTFGPELRALELHLERGGAITVDSEAITAADVVAVHDAQGWPDIAARFVPPARA